MPSSLVDIGAVSRDLQEVGFTDYESRVYIALLHNSPATAYEISKHNAMPRPNVYSSLESLEKKTAVQRVSSDPVRYVPVDARSLLERISRTMADRCTKLQEKLEAVRGEQETNYVWNLSGVDEANAKINKLISGAKRHVWIKGHHQSLIDHLPALTAAANRGVALTLIMFGATTEIDRFRMLDKSIVYAHEGDGTVVGLGEFLVTLTADFEEALIFNMSEATGAFTRNGPVVNLAESLIRHEIYLAEIFGKLGIELEKHFGPALFALRKKYLPAGQVAALESRLRGAPARALSRRASARAPVAAADGVSGRVDQ